MPVAKGEPKAEPKVESKRATLEKATTDFDAVKLWCEQSRNEIADTKKANPLRGDELEKAKLTELRTALKGKSVQWGMKVLDIHRSGAVTLESYYAVGRTLERPNGPIYVDEFHLAVRLKNVASASPTAAWKGDPRFTIGDISAERLRTLTTGEVVAVVGEVTEVELPPSMVFLVEMPAARLK